MSKEFVKEIEDFIETHPVDCNKIALDAMFLLEECAEELENLYGQETELTVKVREFLNR